MTLQEGSERQPKRSKKQKPPPIVFEIVNGHCQRNYLLIEKEKLVVPTDEYQRDESRGRIANEIAMLYDVVAFGALTVIHRSNGELVVADGGTRLAGALKRDDIIVVPCLVFSGLTEKQEADSFLRINLNRRRLRTAQQHHAEVYSEQELALVAQQYENYLADARVGWNGLQAMRGAVKSDQLATDVVVRLLMETATDKHVTTRVFKGLVRLERLLQQNDTTLYRPVVIKKMANGFGSLDIAVNAVVTPRSKGNPTIFARALAK